MSGDEQDLGGGESEEAIGLGLDEPAAQDGNYQVLARKYRPSSFDEMIGHEAMVQMLSNAFETNRIAHAFVLTGVRGIGKTTTARILARALNYADEDNDRPTVHMTKEGEHCRAIAEGRHMDVIEMDAASRTGINDIREIIESVRFLPVSARYKVYIIDEVHMLSNAAFNGLLKTLEEPPPSVKFIFCTTEIRKVPITVLSRCQRFDLKRIDADTLVGYLQKICGLEGAHVAPEGLSLIARAAEGSVRDGMSLLDQAIALGAGAEVSGEQVRDMLGLADRSRVIDLFDFAMKGDIASALQELRSQYDTGADPAVILSDLLEWTHWITRLKLAQSAGKDATVSEAERKRGEEMATSLPINILTRTWQLLLKGLDEVRRAPQPISAAEMVMVRLVYATDLPTPDDLIKQLKDGGPISPGKGAPAPSGGGAKPTTGATAVTPGGTRLQAVAGGGGAAPRVEAAPVAQRGPTLSTFEDLVALAGEKREIKLKTDLEDLVHPVSFAPQRIVVRLAENADGALLGEISAKLMEWTGERWFVTKSDEAGAPTMRAQHVAKEKQRMDDVRAHPLVQKTMEVFPGAEIADIIDRTQQEPEPMPVEEYDDDDESSLDDLFT